MRHVGAFLRFWWNFVVGDDWRGAAGLAVILPLTWALAHHGLPAWWLLPSGVAVVLASSVLRGSDVDG
jgi:hypothetical protein